MAAFVRCDGLNVKLAHGRPGRCRPCVGAVELHAAIDQCTLRVGHADPARKWDWSSRGGQYSAARPVVNGYRVRRQGPAGCDGQGSARGSGCPNHRVDAVQRSRIRDRRSTGQVHDRNGRLLRQSVVHGFPVVKSLLEFGLEGRLNYRDTRRIVEYLDRCRFGSVKQPLVPKGVEDHACVLPVEVVAGAYRSRGPHPRQQCQQEPE